MGTYVSKARETATNPRSTGPREALCGLIPGWREAKHTYGYAYGTESGAARRPMYEPLDPGGLQEEVGPKRKKTNDEPTRRRSVQVCGYLGIMRGGSGLSLVPFTRIGKIAGTFG